MFITSPSFFFSFTPSRIRNVTLSALVMELCEESSTCVIGTCTRDSLNSSKTILLDSRTISTQDQTSSSMSERRLTGNRLVFVIESIVIKQDCISLMFNVEWAKLLKDSFFTFFTTGSTYGFNSSVRKAPTPTLTLFGLVSALYFAVKSKMTSGGA